MKSEVLFGLLSVFFIFICVRLFLFESSLKDTGILKFINSFMVKHLHKQENITSSVNAEEYVVPNIVHHKEGNKTSRKNVEEYVVPNIVHHKEGNKTSRKNVEEYVVPNIVHYIWFSRNGNEEMKFHHLLSIISAYKFIKPDAIHYHYDVLPRGKWWDYVKKHVPILVLLKTERPKEIFGVRLLQTAHQSDIKRFDIMRTTGGIYLDNDVLVFKSFGPLRKYNFTLGQEMPGSVGNGVIVGARNTTFLNLWWNTYRNFTNREWAYHACIIPAQLWKMYPHLIHVEIKTMQYPDWTDTGLRLLYDTIYDWSKNYCVHMWYRQRPVEYTPENIKKMNTTFGQMARYIFYDKKEIIQK